MNKKEELVKEIIEGALLLPFEIDQRQLKMIIMNLDQRVYMIERKEEITVDDWEKYGKERGY